MKLIIAGSRSIKNKQHVLEALQKSGISAQEVSEIVCGGASGVDALGAEIANDFSIPVKYILAEWTKYGKRAGMMRNKRMATYADRLVAVWDGESKGTGDMIDLMKKADKEYYTHMV